MSYTLQATDLISDALVWDNHGCMPLRPADESFLPQIDRYYAAGVNVVSLNIGFGPQAFGDHARTIASFRRWFMNRPDRYVLASAWKDIEQAKAEGKLAVVFDIEGMALLDEGDGDAVQMFYDLGVRWMLVAYNRNNGAGGGCSDDDAGLTPHGRRILAEMKRVGMVVCCSHTGHRTAREVIEAADNPVIFSHSNASRVHEHYRNIPDDLIKACAEGDGVVGVNGIGAFLGQNDCSPEAVVRHVDHMVQLVGPRHVGIGLDYVFDQEELLEVLTQMRDTFPDQDMSDYLPLRLMGPEGILPVVERLLAMGYVEADLRSILGGNWQRIARQVWR
jgi:membrane dipeptidase